MTIFVFGNEDLKEDSLPLRILPQLRDKFPDIEFEFKDPNEEWEIPSKNPGDIPGDITVIDTVMGIKDVQVFDNLDKFSKTPNLTMHDFDALSNLRYLQKLGKIKKVKIIGVPQGLDEREAIEKIIKILI